VQPVCPIDPAGTGAIDKAFGALHHALVRIRNAGDLRPKADTEFARDRAVHRIRDLSEKLWGLVNFDVETLQGEIETAIGVAGLASTVADGSPEPHTDGAAAPAAGADETERQAPTVRGAAGAGASASRTSEMQSQPPPDGPCDPNGFRFRGAQLSWGKATLRKKLTLALWDREGRRPRPPRPTQEVIEEVYGADEDTTESTFRALISDTRGMYQKAGLPLDIKNEQGQIWLVVRPE
jgi:hypothetical protein